MAYLTKQEKKRRLDRLFDLDSLSIEQLEDGYVYPMMSLHPGFGSKLFKHNGKYVNESEEKTVPAKQALGEITRKYGLMPWQTNVMRACHGIDACLCIADVGNAIISIKEDMEHMGWFVSVMTYVTDPNGVNWFKMQFEPRYQKDQTEEIKRLYTILLHLTPLSNLGSISRNGLTPRCENSTFKYPNRVYMFSCDATESDINSMGNALATTSAHKGHNFRFVMLAINCNALPDDIRLYYDPNYKYGVFTETTIPPQYIRPIREIQFRKQV